MDPKEPLTLVAALDEAEKKATPGPWVVGVTLADHGWPVMRLRDMVSGASEEGERNAEFVEALRNAWPSVSASFKEQAQEIERLRETGGPDPEGICGTLKNRVAVEKEKYRIALEERDIERALVESSTSKLSAATEALEFYADELNWRASLGMEYDAGTKARAALNAIREETK